MSLPDRLRARLGQTEMHDLPLLDEVLDGSGHVFDGHALVDAVLVEEIDAIRPQALQRCPDNTPDALWTAVKPDRAVDRKAELSGNLHLVADRLQCLADQFFARVRPVDFRRVEEGDAVTMRLPKCRDALRSVGCGAVIGADVHRTRTQFPVAVGQGLVINPEWVALAGSGEDKSIATELRSSSIPRHRSPRQALGHDRRDEGLVQSRRPRATEDDRVTSSLEHCTAKYWAVRPPSLVVVFS